MLFQFRWHYSDEVKAIDEYIKNDVTQDRPVVKVYGNNIGAALCEFKRRVNNHRKLQKRSIKRHRMKWIDGESIDRR